MPSDPFTAHIPFYLGKTLSSLLGAPVHAPQVSHLLTNLILSSSPTTCQHCAGSFTIGAYLSKWKLKKINLGVLQSHTAHTDLLESNSSLDRMLASEQSSPAICSCAGDVCF